MPSNKKLYKDKWIDLRDLEKMFGVGRFQDIPKASKGRILTKQRAIYKDPSIFEPFYEGADVRDRILTFNFESGEMVESDTGGYYDAKFKLINNTPTLSLKGVYNVE